MALIALFHKKSYPLVERHLSGVHLDADYKPGVAQQRILQLSESDHFGITGVARARSRLAVALIEHHLLAIVGPAFGIRVGSQKLAHLAWRLRSPQELYVVSWISLVN